MTTTEQRITLSKSESNEYEKERYVVIGEDEIAEFRERKLTKANGNESDRPDSRISLSELQLTLDAARWR